MLMLDVAADISAIVLYGLTLHVSNLAWIFTGLSVCIRSLFHKIDTTIMVISMLQLSDTCDKTRVLLYGPSIYIVGFFVLCLSVISRQDLFRQRSEEEKRAFVCLMMTVALSTRGAVQHRLLFNVLKVSIYVLLCRVSDNNLSVWEVQARSCWIFSAYWYPLIIVALLQVSVDAESYEITVKRKSFQATKTIETWDISI